MRFAISALLLFALSAGTATAAAPAPVDIPYEKFVLSNGLTLLVHEDRKAPIVAVNVWYHVGSKNEKRGRTGFAHLFEHLMFNGSENFNSDYFKATEKLGATNMNGTTNEDRTNYFENVPVSALDTVLWLESDRMGHLIGAIDQAKLDEQRGVVQNEKRQYENEPYGKMEDLIPEATYPVGHPYSWSVIGSMEDLSAATLADVQEWFRTYYGPSNAVIAIAGDIDAKTAKAKVEKYFGAFPPGPPIARPSTWIAKMTGTQRRVMQDRVPLTRIVKIWNTPPDFTRENDLLDIAASVLGQGKTSRLFKRLVYDEQIAQDVSAYQNSKEIGGQFWIEADVRPGVPAERVEKAIDEELAKFLAEGPTAAELERVKTRVYAGFVRGIERIGGFGGKSDVLARGEVFAGNPAAYKGQMANLQSATAADVKNNAVKWLSDGVFVLEVQPYGELKASGADADRTKMPEPGPPPALRLPKLERAKLSNGLNIILAERHEIPVVSLSLLVDAGYAADSQAVPGTSRLAMSMMDEGTAKRTSLQISDELDSLGANLRTGSNLDLSFVSLNALKANLDKSLEVWADVALNPSFPQADFEREQKRQMASIQQEKSEPVTMATRVLAGLVYGTGHAYAGPLTGSGYEASVKSITRDTLVKFHQAWFKPNNATLVIAGDTTLAEITPKLERLLSAWKPGEVPKKNVAQVNYRKNSVVYMLDKPGAIQSVVLAAQVAPPTNNPDEIAFETLNTLLGGMFTSRINMNIREDKHWSYGARSFLSGARGQRPFIAYAPVQSDKTKETVQEILGELKGVVKGRPVTADELRAAQDNLTLSLPGSRETQREVLSTMADLVQYNLPEDYYETYTGKVRALTTADMQTAAGKLLRPDALVWVVVGDRAKIEPGIKELGLGEIHHIDADGNPVQ